MSIETEDKVCWTTCIIRRTCYKTNQASFYARILQSIHESRKTCYYSRFHFPCHFLFPGEMDHWPAMNERSWANLEYLKVESTWIICLFLQKCAGYRTVPIEVGSNYLASKWSQKLTTLSTFIDNYVNNKSEDIGYLAQTQLFDQIPELRKGYIIYCITFKILRLHFIVDFLKMIIS